MPRPLDAPAAYPRRFRRLLWAVAPASQPSVCVCYRTSECSAPGGSYCSALRRGDAALRSLTVSALSGRCLDRAGRQPTTTMASADFCRPIDSPCDEPSPWAGRQISQGKTRDFPPTYPPHIRRLDPDDIGLRVYAPPRPPRRRLVCDSCSSGREFAFRFLQIPGRPGHPCGSARSSCHQGLHRDFHPASQIPGSLSLPGYSVRS
jgi:hypothetical protein